MDVNGQIVGQRLTERVKPILRDLGFTRFQGRHSWRRTPISVDVVAFPSITAPIAEGVGCTVFSFGSEAGVYYPALTDADSRPVGLPRSWHLSFRGIAGKSLRQPFFHPWGTYPTGDEVWRLDRADVWYVLPDGSNLDEVLDDATETMLNQEIPFIERYRDPRRAIESLNDPETHQSEPDFGRLGTWVPDAGTPRAAKEITLLETLL